MTTPTIVAIATPPGRGAVGIVRVSGPQTVALAAQLTGQNLKPRLATLCTLRDNRAENIHSPENIACPENIEPPENIDQVIALLFSGPASYTGEDVLELHAHGNPIILDRIVACIVSHGAVLARPGQFTERAFINGKLDLAQAEAVADLIDSSSKQAAASALRSLQGKFSSFITNIVQALIRLRVFVEATLDFPDEDVDFIHAEKIAQQLGGIAEQIAQTISAAQTGVLLREGFQLTLVGAPNAGKSSLLNQLTGQNTAIVTAIPGTTRDIVSESISIAGIPVRISDTAGLRVTTDEVEREGIRRAHGAMATSDRVLLVVDAAQCSTAAVLQDVWPEGAPMPEDPKTVILVRNKIDLNAEQPSVTKQADNYIVSLSALTGAGINGLVDVLKESIGFQEQQGTIIARRRHLSALQAALQAVQYAQNQSVQGSNLELIAEELRHAQHSLSEITGVYTSDDLLGEIFSSFCIGK